MENTYIELMACKKIELDKAVVRVNEARAARDMDAVTEARAECGILVEEYNTYSRTNFFLECFEKENPMVHAIKVYEYPTIQCVDKMSETLNRFVLSEKETRTAVDLREMLLFARDRSLPLGAQPNWSSMIDELATRLEVYACRELNSSVPKKTAGTAIYARIQAELAADENALSKNKLLAFLESVVLAMLGEGYGVIKQDINRLIMSEIKESRQGRSLTAKSSKKMMESIMSICNKSITHNEYAIRTKGKDYFAEAEIVPATAVADA